MHAVLRGHFPGHRGAPYLADQSTRPWIGSAAGGRGINRGELLVGELNDGHPRRGLTDVRDAKSEDGSTTRAS